MIILNQTLDDIFLMEISNIESKLDEAISIPKNTISHPSTFKESIK